MKKNLFTATDCICETFEKKGVKYKVYSEGGREAVFAGFSINNGPNVFMSFVSTDNENDVAARIYGMISRIPAEKRLSAMEACNSLNNKFRFLKFYIDEKGDINVEYDFVSNSDTKSIGEMALEIFIRSMGILDEGYEILAKALYSTNNSMFEEKAVWETTSIMN